MPKKYQKLAHVLGGQEVLKKIQEVLGRNVKVYPNIHAIKRGEGDNPNQEVVVDLIPLEAGEMGKLKHHPYFGPKDLDFFEREVGKARFRSVKVRWPDKVR